MTNFNIKDSLSVSRQGAVVAAMGALNKFKKFFTEPAKHLSNVVSRLGLGAAVASMAFVALSAIPTQAQAQNTVQQINQMNFITAATGLAAEMKGLDRRSVELARLAALGAGAATKSSNAPVVAGIVGLGAVMAMQSNNPQSGLSENTGSRGGFVPGNSYQQSGNSQNQAVQDAYASYQRIAEPQYRIAVQAHLDGNTAARDDAIAKFSTLWGRAITLGIPVHTYAKDVFQFQQLKNVDVNNVLGVISTPHQQIGSPTR